MGPHEPFRTSLHQRNSTRGSPRSPPAQPQNPDSGRMAKIQNQTSNIAKGRRARGLLPRTQYRDEEKETIFSKIAPTEITRATQGGGKATTPAVLVQIVCATRYSVRNEHAIGGGRGRRLLASLRAGWGAGAGGRNVNKLQTNCPMRPFRKIRSSSAFRRQKKRAQIEEGR